MQTNDFSVSEGENGSVVIENGNNKLSFGILYTPNFIGGLGGMSITPAGTPIVKLKNIRVVRIISQKNPNDTNPGPKEWYRYEHHDRCMDCTNTELATETHPYGVYFSTNPY